MRSLTETPNLSQPAPSPKMRISAPVPRNLQSGRFPHGLQALHKNLVSFWALSKPVLLCLSHVSVCVCAEYHSTACDLSEVRSARCW